MIHYSDIEIKAKMLYPLYQHSKIGGLQLGKLYLYLLTLIVSSYSSPFDYISFANKQDIPRLIQTLGQQLSYVSQTCENLAFLRKICNINSCENNIRTFHINSLI